MLLVWFAVLLLLLVSCLPTWVPPSFSYTTRAPYTGQPRQIKVQISQDISAADTLEIQRAIDQWNYALNGNIHIEICSTTFSMGIDDIHHALDTGGWIIVPISKNSPMVPAARTDNNGQEHDTGAFVNKIGGNVIYLVRDGIMDTWVYGITMHEIGHLLGAQHVGKGLMAPDFNMYSYQCIDLETVQQVAIKQGLDINGLNYCVNL